MPQLVKIAQVMRRFTLEKWGGTETVVFNLSRELIRRGIESPIYCTDMFSKPGRETVDGVPVNRFRYCFPWFGLSAEAKARLRLKGGSPLSLSLFFALLREKNLSLIHTHIQHRMGGIARTVAQLRSIPYVVSIHGGHFTIPDDQNEAMQDPFRGKLEWGKLFGWLFGARRTLADADAVLCVGENEYREVQSRFPDKSVHYIPNGVEVDRFRQADPAPFREAFGFNANDKLLLCLSRIDYQKNQLLLVDAFTDFAASHPEWKLVLIGPVTVEAYHRRILEAVEQAGLKDRVCILPGLKPDDPLLPSAYKAADLFVLPTSHEPFGIVILEAWAAGTPVIATRIGGIPGFSAHEVNLLHFEDRDRTGLRAQMERMAGDPEFRARLVRAAAEEVKKYDWSAIAEKVLTVYRETLNRHQGSR